MPRAERLRLWRLVSRWLFVALAGAFFPLSTFAAKDEALGRPELYLSTGSAHTAAARHVHTTLAEKWPELSAIENFDRAGFYQIYLGVLGKRILFPYFAGLSRSERLRFVNFGEHGFFVGMAAETSRGGDGEARSASADVTPFEKLEWGTLYLTPATVRTPGFLRDHFLTSHGLSLIRRSVQEVFAGSLASADLRSAYLLVWSGGANCLASEEKGEGPQHRPPSWMRCDPRLGTKLSQLSDLSDDDQFFFLISGRQANSESWSCRALGVLEQTGIQGFGLVSGPKGRCILYRSPFDDNWGVRSKVHCLDPIAGQHLWGNFDHVDFAFPTSDPERFFLVESRFAPPRLTEVSLAKGFSRTLGKGEGALGLTAKPGQKSGPVQGLPQGDYGIYQCQATVLGQLERRLYFVDEDVFKGRRQVRPEEDWVYSYKPGRPSGLASESASWAQMMDAFPPIDDFPEMSCAYELDIDVKCGVRVLQSAIQMLWEHRTGALGLVGTPAVVSATTKIQSQLLRRVATALPDWGLRAETAFLLAEYERLLHDKDGRGGPAPLRQSLPADNSWRRYVSTPERFWQ